MLNQILWTIDNELDGGVFERLCVDLLFRNGYRDIVPIEPQDGGRDAEEFPRRGRSRAGEAAFFQFSLETDWKGKLRRDARRLSGGGHEFSKFVFVTSQKARGVDIDSLGTELRKKYGWDLIVYSREWLRLQLEEAHPDLAQKYLGVGVPEWSEHLSTRLRFKKSTDNRLSEAWPAFEARAYHRAAVEFRDFLDEQPEDRQAWQALAWCQYCTYRYDEALGSINRALKLDEDLQGLSIRACILAEKGIKEGSRASVIEARQLFEQVLESNGDANWEVYYNLGNVLSALGDHDQAVTRYRQALKLESSEPRIWKNLASAYHFLADHETEMKCFDRVLELDPMMPQALFSKGVCLLTHFQEPEEAAVLLERALRSSPEWVIQWPRVWYWLAEAHLKYGSLDEALKWVEAGLAHQPGHLALLRLKSELLAKLVVQDPSLVQVARHFWETHLKSQPLDYEARRPLAELEIEADNESAVWDLLDECFELIGIEPRTSLRTSGFKPNECLAALEFLPQYARFREFFPVSVYWNPEDPLYDLPFSPPQSDSIVAALTTYLSVPFGLGVRALDLEEAASRDGKTCLRKFFESLRPKIEHALIEGARELAGLIPSREEGSRALANKLTEVIVFLGLVALREFGAQRGWIIAQFRVTKEAMNSAFDDYDEAQIQTNVVSNSLITLNEEARFAPDS